MNYLIVGSRSITDFDLRPYIGNDAELIISGGASGVDSLAEAFADKNKISKLIIYPDYKKYGKFAPLKRNEKMVELADTVIIVWDGKSNGTKYTIEYAKRRNKKITLLSP